MPMSKDERKEYDAFRYKFGSRTGKRKTATKPRTNRGLRERQRNRYPVEAFVDPAPQAPPVLRDPSSVDVVVGAYAIQHAVDIHTRREWTPQAEDSIAPNEHKHLSWQDYLERTTPRERKLWCVDKCKAANKDRLMSGKPVIKVTPLEVWALMVRQKGRCYWCGSLAVEGRPSAPEGGPLPWKPIGRRIGSLDHIVSRVSGGDNDVANLVWSCLWCNTWATERRWGATDHGGYFPEPLPNTIAEEGNAT